MGKIVSRILYLILTRATLKKSRDLGGHAFYHLETLARCYERSTKTSRWYSETSPIIIMPLQEPFLKSCMQTMSKKGGQFPSLFFPSNIKDRGSNGVKRDEIGP